ncbi:hypothetical protein [Longimicrobium sp.]|uniref:hypothetical protein n=1 Tax=Longimicrobium sp. TaxID=2029185 RepID=UPI002C947F98|nr:hypothetical protein [Longimicrobium sp.]HSU13034.1 hypothetical protein [Longimicrobium sp.]
MHPGKAGGYGCVRCWPADADAAWEARQALRREAEMADEPHFHVMVLACGACGQRFLSVFIETVDWGNGDDPQHWSLLPLTAHEAAKLRGGLSAPALEALGRHRRSLRRDHPAGGAARAFWSTGVATAPHD